MPGAPTQEQSLGPPGPLPEDGVLAPVGVVEDTDLMMVTPCYR